MQRPEHPRTSPGRGNGWRGSQNENRKGWKRLVGSSSGTVIGTPTTTARGASPNLSLNTARTVTPPLCWTSLQCLITHSVKKFFLMSKLSLPWRKLGSCPLILSLLGTALNPQNKAARNAGPGWRPLPPPSQGAYGETPSHHPFPHHHAPRLSRSPLREFPPPAQPPPAPALTSCRAPRAGRARHRRCAGVGGAGKVTTPITPRPPQRGGQEVKRPRPSLVLTPHFDHAPWLAPPRRSPRRRSAGAGGDGRGSALGVRAGAAPARPRLVPLHP